MISRAKHKEVVCLRCVSCVTSVNTKNVFSSSGIDIWQDRNATPPAVTFGNNGRSIHLAQEMRLKSASSAGLRIRENRRVNLLPSRVPLIFVWNITQWAFNYNKGREVRKEKEKK